MQVHHRPVVNLVVGSGQRGQKVEAQKEEEQAPAQEPAPQPERVEVAAARMGNTANVASNVKAVVEEVAEPCSDENTVSADTDALKVLTKMRQNGVSRLLVTDRDHLVAIVSLKDLLGFVAKKLELDGGPVGLPRLSA